MIKTSKKALFKVLFGFFAIASLLLNLAACSDDSDSGGGDGGPITFQNGVTYTYSAGGVTQKLIFDKDSNRVIFRQIDDEGTTEALGTYTGNTQTANDTITVTINAGDSVMSMEGTMSADLEKFSVTKMQGETLSAGAMEYTKSTTQSDDGNNNPPPTTYTLTFDKNAPTDEGGEALTVSGTMANMTFTQGVKKALTKCAYSVSGYKFMGWSITSESNSVYYADEAELTLDTNKILYAVWKADSEVYTITFDGNGGTVGSDTTVEQYVSKGIYTTYATLKANEFTYTGHVFTGWAKTQNATKATYLDKATYYSIEGDFTLYAVWREGDGTKSVVTFNKGLSDTGTDVTQELTIDKEGEKLKAFSTIGFTKQNYAFDGWATSLTGNKLFEDEATIDWSKDTFKHDITLYACWKNTTEEGKVIITFNGNGGTTNTSETTKTQKVNTGERVTLDANTFTKSGYIFMGWSPYTNGTSVSYTDRATYTNTNYDRNLYAVWAKELTITFDGKGGATTSGATTTTQKVASGQSVTLNANTFKKSGYSFYGWSTSSTASSRSYTDEESATFSRDTTLYAFWIEGDKVELDPNGGTGSKLTPALTDKGSGTYTFTFPSSGLPTKTGYIFMGWAVSGGYSNMTGSNTYGKQIYAPGTTLTVTGGKTYYAAYFNKSVTLTYYGYDESCYHSKIGECNKPNTPEAVSYTLTDSDRNIKEATGYKYYAIEKQITLAAQAPSYLENTSTNTNYGFYGWTETNMSADSGNWKYFNTCAAADSSNTVYQPSSTYTLKGTTTLYPAYLPTTATDAYCVTYDNNSSGVNNHTNFIMVKKGGTHKVLPKYTDWKKLSGTFSGNWGDAKKSPTNTYPVGTNITINAAKTLWAQW